MPSPRGLCSDVSTVRGPWGAILSWGQLWGVVRPFLWSPGLRSHQGNGSCRRSCQAVVLFPSAPWAGGRPLAKATVGAQ